MPDTCTQKRAATVLRQLADQIEAACRGHKLTCGSRGLFVVPAIQTSDIGPILSSTADTTGYICRSMPRAPTAFRAGRRLDLEGSDARHSRRAESKGVPG